MTTSPVDWLSTLPATVPPVMVSSLAVMLAAAVLAAAIPFFLPHMHDRYFFAADAENAGRGLAFIIRWRADVQPGMWVKWNGEKQNITTLGEYDFKRRYLKLTTESAKGVR